MNFRSGVVFVLLLAGVVSTARGDRPLACRMDALDAKQQARHQLLGQRLKQSVVERVALPQGYALTLDLSRLPRDSAGLPFCVVEVAEWVDLESRCCPFLDFGIDVRGEGGVVQLRLTGPPGVREFLEDELALVGPKGSSGRN